jgi:hypothetical protein
VQQSVKLRATLGDTGSRNATLFETVPRFVKLCHASQNYQRLQPALGARFKNSFKERGI